MASAEVQHAGSLSETGWVASIELGFSRRNERTVLAEKRQYGPLTVQRSFYPEGDICHLYLLHPPGGIAGGDRLEVQVTTHPQSHALITTPGAAKFYRSSGPTAFQTQQFHLNSGCLEWLPQENIFFPGAQVDMLTEINLNDDANYIGWEIHCLGRPVINERFECGQLISKTVVNRDNVPPADRPSRHRWRTLPLWKSDTARRAGNCNTDRISGRQRGTRCGKRCHCRELQP